MMEIKNRNPNGPCNDIEESCPDIEIILNISRKDNTFSQIPLNINKNRTVLELKRWLSAKLTIDADHLRMFFNDIEMEDSNKILYYEVECDDELTLIEESPTAPA